MTYIEKFEFSFCLRLALWLWLFWYQIFDKFYINFILTASMKHTKALEQALDSEENISEVNL